MEQVEHIVVLMLENRSFDNVLGWLYDSENAPPFNKVPAGQSFDGVSGKGLSNPGPDGRPVPVGSTLDTTNPFPDPGEEYAQVYGQLYGVNPPPATVPAEPPQPPPMSGFVANYALQKGVKQPSNILNGFRPATLPVLSTLANAFAVCDRWFASVPSQTLTNRSFVHAGTASGHVNNESDAWPYFIFTNNTPTLFNLMEQQGLGWKVYYGGHWFLCNAYLGQAQLGRYMHEWEAPLRFFSFASFLEDARSGNLPAYSFIEPNFMDSLEYGRENDMHPDAAVLDDDDHPADVRYGDELIRKVYEALRTSPKWNNTLLVITYDEHGGCYDHVPPPAAVPPDTRSIPPGKPGYSGFRFDRLGVRVPAVVVSPLIAQGLVDHTIRDHTSILRTVMDCFQVRGSLTARVDAASSLAGLLTLDTPRTDCPALPEPVAADDKPAHDGPLTDFQRTLVRAAAQHLQSLTHDVVDPSRLDTKLQAEAELKRLDEMRTR